MRWFTATAGNTGRLDPYPDSQGISAAIRPPRPRVSQKLDAILPAGKKRFLPAGKLYLFTSDAGSLLASKVGSFLASAEAARSQFRTSSANWTGCKRPVTRSRILI